MTERLANHQGCVRVVEGNKSCKPTPRQISERDLTFPLQRREYSSLINSLNDHFFISTFDFLPCIAAGEK